LRLERARCRPSQVQIENIVVGPTDRAATSERALDATAVGDVPSRAGAGRAG